MTWTDIAFGIFSFWKTPLVLLVVYAFIRVVCWESERSPIPPGAHLYIVAPLILLFLAYQWSEETRTGTTLLIFLEILPAVIMGVFFGIRSYRLDRTRIAHGDEGDE